MNCRRVQKLLPLFVGGDLPEGRTQRMESHIAHCADCLRERDIFVEKLRSAQSWLAQPQPEWEESAWRRVLGEAVTAASRGSRPWQPWPFRPVWAYLSMAVLAAALTVWVVKPLPETGDPEHLLAASSSSSQDIVSMTLVSQETGLKVQWFLNRNFDLKEDIE